MKYIFFTLFIGLFCISCNNQETNSAQKKYLPPSSGTHAEMMLVVENALWKSQTGKALIESLGQPQYGLPQSEGIFSLNRIAPADFQGLLKRTKSLIFIERGDSVIIESKRDVWASPQLVTTITAPTEREILEILKTNESKLIEAYHKSDLNAVRIRMKKFTYKQIPSNLGDFDIEQMDLQKGFNQTLNKPDIKIFRQETKKTTQFLVFSTRPIKDDVLPGQDIVAARDSIGKRYFEGSADSSYFATEMLFPPQQVTSEVDNKFAIETRGMWKTIGDFMGGPFISYTIFNDEKNEILTIEGFIFGPDAKKRNVLLEMEAMITSIKFKK